MTVERGVASKVRAALDRPRLWRATAALSAVALCGLVLACAQGSLTILAHRPPATGSRGAARTPGWVRWCTHGKAREDRRRLAFCARVEGRVLTSTHGPAPGETHIAVLGDFHILLVRLPAYAATPGTGARIVAIGPLFRARNGQREVQAFRFDMT